jgi:hypothetical protein
MKARPLLFSAPMIRALLAGRKMQTRRLVKYTHPLGDPAKWSAEATTETLAWAGANSYCPHGRPGDHIWVKETFAPSVSHPDALTMPEYDGGKNPAHLYYRADVRNGQIDGCDADRIKWKPSIFMPRWASRITLEVDDVRVEKLSSISEEDAKAEGVKLTRCTHQDCSPGSCAASSYRGAYAVLWNEINGATAPWGADPFVWVITFRVLDA